MCIRDRIGRWRSLTRTRRVLRRGHATARAVRLTVIMVRALIEYASSATNDQDSERSRQGTAGHDRDLHRTTEASALAACHRAAVLALRRAHDDWAGERLALDPGHSG